MRPVVLTEEQKAVIAHRSGPLSVIAAAGSGKTQTLVQRTTEGLLKRDFNPDTHVVLTHTQSAAREFKDRLRQRWYFRPPHVGTIHSWAWGWLNRLWAPGSTRLATGDGRHLAQQALKDCSLPSSPSYVDAVLAASSAIALGLSLPPVPPALTWERLDAVLGRFRTLKASLAYLDFNDTLAYLHARLEWCPGELERVRRETESLVVDEAQDLNILQAQLLRTVCSPDISSCMVGDPRQAIFGFDGGSSVHLTGWSSDVLELSTNFRSTRQIVEFASQFGPGKVTTVKEGAEVEVFPPGHYPKPLPGDAVLARTNRELDELERVQGVTYSTIHQAKGQEWERVHLIGVKEDFQGFGSVAVEALDLAEEELRLLYVACTRAREALAVYHSEAT